MRFAIAFLMYCGASLAQTTDVKGDWVVNIVRFGEPDYTRLNLESKNGHYIGKIWGDVQLDGVLKGAAIEFQCTYKEENKQEKSSGNLSVSTSANEMHGQGKLFDEPASFSAQRDTPWNGTPRTHQFTPTHFYRQFSGATQPALHINPSDTIQTKCVDAGGVDEKGEHRSQGGNPLTGPFYVDGAVPGDTLVVHLNRVRLNRDTAGIYNDTVVGSAVDPYYFRDLKRVKDFDSSWKLDRTTQTAMLTKPTDRLKDFKISLHPMLGCVGVAPPARQAFRSGNLGNYGGNMDYNQLREGATLYIPVFQLGALLFVGDGHATEGDGELTGNALETSMDVEFTVDLIRGKSLGQPRAENSEYVMVSGIGGSLNDALQAATTGMSRWLEDEYKLNPGEIAMVLGSSMRYDIAEVVDSQVHVVAKLSKTVLSQIPKPK
ncbi:MAG: acetamidase/formamidase family protein [Bryobacteraceae bacterium]